MIWQLQKKKKMFTSCKNSDEEINSTEPTTLKVEKYSIGECPDSIDVSNLFSKYSKNQG